MLVIKGQTPSPTYKLSNKYWNLKGDGERVKNEWLSVNFSLTGLLLCLQKFRANIFKPTILFRVCLSMYLTV